MKFLIVTVCLFTLVEKSYSQSPCPEYAGCICMSGCGSTHPESLPPNLIGECPTGESCCCGENVADQCTASGDDCVCSMAACGGDRPNQSSANDCPAINNVDTPCCCETVTTGEDACTPDPCENGGTCSVTATGYDCECPPGFVGTNCEIELNECEVNPCKNGGTCHDKVNAFECECPPPWIRPTCETQAPACAAHEGCECMETCGNTHPVPLPEDLIAICATGKCCCKLSSSGDNCKEAGEGCVCMYPSCTSGKPFEMAGLDCPLVNGNPTDCCCEQPDACNSNPCVHGTCNTTADGYECDCEDGWEGKNCDKPIKETPDYCNPSPCHNHATCIMKEGTFICQCRQGFTGRLCQNRDCKCQNGGLCVQGKNPSCACPYPWYGDQCQYFRKNN